MKGNDINNRWLFVRGAIPFIGIGLVFTIISACYEHIILSILLGIITSFVAFFFRDPDRRVLSFSEKQILSPADGKVVEVRDVGNSIKVAIFMSLLDIHVNRVPVSGTIKDVIHTSGRFLRADLEKASQMNEKNRVVLIPDNQIEPFVLIQIAGLIARRIVCWVKEGDRVMAGQRFGLICFGSRVELFMDKRCNIIVEPGQKVKAGIDIIGYMP